MNITGTLDEHGDLVIERTFRSPIADVWASVTESVRLARWFGTWEGDPGDGYVMVTMNAEAESVPPVRYEIHACEPPRLLSVSATDSFGHWHLTAELSEGSGTTTLILRQIGIDPSTLGDTGPGWEWYLDRLVAAVNDESPPDLEAFESTYMPMVPAYTALIEH